jgi:hypothetical protein
MPVKIRIIIKDIALNAELFDTACAQEIAEVLPVSAFPDSWGDEFYFEIPVAQMFSDDTATTSVKVGDIGYWPPANALAIFFGPTLMSKGSDPVPASPVNLVGRIDGDPTVLRKVKDAQEIRIERVS